MKPTKELTPTASAKLDNYIHINFEDVNEMTDAEQHAQELENAGLITDSSLDGLTDQEWDKVCVKYDESDEWMGE
jgi:hypothetical protein